MLLQDHELTRVAVWHDDGPLTLEEMELPPPGPGEVVIRISLATVCGSDLHTAAGHRSSPSPSVLGHEAVGTVTAVGEGGAVAVGGARVSPGDRVVWSVTVSCGRCDRCASGRTAKCRELRKVGHEAFTSDWPLSGGYAQHILLPAGAAIVVVPETMPDAVAAPAACATATVMAALEEAGALAGRRVLISGAGMLGLTAAAAARARGAASVTVSDPDPGRLALAGRFGATSMIRPGEQVTPVDVALEFSGASSAFLDGLDLLDVNGRIVLVGAVSTAMPVPVDPERIVRNWLSLAGVHNYEPHHLVEAVAFLDATAATLPWADLVAPPLPLDQLADLLTRRPGTQPRTSITP